MKVWIRKPLNRDEYLDGDYILSTLFGPFLEDEAFTATVSVGSCKRR